MLIKKKKLTAISGGRQESRIPQLEHSELGKAVQLELHKARQEAKLIKSEAEKILRDSQLKLKEAEEKAAKIISSANQEANGIKEKAYRETIEAAAQEAEAIKSHARTQLKELFEVKRKVLNEANQEIIKLALELAEKIIRHKASVDPEILQTQIVDAIKKATTEADRVQVYVNPIDLKLLEEHLSSLERLFPTGIQIVSLTNESVDPGSCIVETKSGQLDARFSTQLQALANLLSVIEVSPPNVEISEEIPKSSGKSVSPSDLSDNPMISEDTEEISAEDSSQTFSAALTETDIEQEELPLTEEEETLKEELLSDEPLISIEEENQFPFSQEEVQSNPFAQTISKPQAEIPTQPEEKVTTKPSEEHIPEQSIKTTKKKLSLGKTTYTQDEEELYFDEDEEKEEEYKSILRPKKEESSSVSEIAEEIKKDPEWKNRIEEDEDER